MPDAVFKDLCVDVSDVATSSAFYAALLGLTKAPDRDRLDGERPEHAIWLNVVPEPKTVKNRVHLDVYAGARDVLRAAGATVVAEQPRWTVMADPEGQEFCAFWRDEPPAYRLSELAFDAVDPERIARWWADRLGTTARHVDDDSWWTVGAAPASRLPWDITFGEVPEPKTAKNRVHWDVWGDPRTLVAAGATWLRPRDAEIGWDVLADPEGNEFCVFSPTP